MEYLLDFATSESVCRRRLISRYFDSTEMECSYVPCERCDVCCQQNRLAPLSEQDFGSDDDYHIWQSAELFAAVDSHPSTGVSNTTHGQQLLASELHLGQQIAFFVTKYRTKCIVCQVARGLTEDHIISCCPTLIGRSMF